MRSIKLLKLFMVISLFLIINGCGTDENPDNNIDEDPIPSVKQGVFIDSAVEGLSYSTTTQSGSTDENGTFNFVEGDNIQFKLGGVILGASVKATNLMTPLDLVPEANNVSDSNVVKITRFILSFDDDNNFRNGIKITSQVDEAIKVHLAGFNLLESDLDNNEDLQALFDYLNQSALFSDGGNRSIVSEFTATEHLNELIYGGIWRLTFESYDNDNDGEIDMVLYYTYNESNHDKEDPSTITLDSDNDGIMDTSYKYFYDENGNLIRVLNDIDNDNIPDSIFAFVYDVKINEDGKNNRIYAKYDEDGDGDFDMVTHYIYREDGKVVLQDLFDMDNDGDTDALNQYYYNHEKYDDLMTEEHFDNNNDGKDEWVKYYEYDSQKNIISMVEDSKDDGIFDSKITYSYDSQNRITKQAMDTDNNGVANNVYKYYYSSTGNKSKATYDKDNDGTVDASVFYMWEKVYMN